MTSYIGFYQKYGFRLVTNNMIHLAKKVSNYKVKDIITNLKKIIKFVEKYNFYKYTTISKLSDFIYNIAYLYFLIFLHTKLSQFFFSLNNIKIE